MGVRIEDYLGGSFAFTQRQHFRSGMAPFL